MDLRDTIQLIIKRPRMFVLDASGLYHFLYGVISEKRDSNQLLKNEINLLQCFMSWKMKELSIESPYDLFKYYDSIFDVDGLELMAKDIMYSYNNLLQNYNNE